MKVIEVFADVTCPFTHVGLRRFVARRSALGRDDVRLRVHAWPLELVNGEPFDPELIAEEIDELRPQLDEAAFVGFDAAAFPATSMPALALAEAAYGAGLEVGERVSLELRDLLFERGADIADPTVLDDVARRHGVQVDDGAAAAVLADYASGRERGVIGSPHFFVGDASFFCPGLSVSRDAAGHLVVTPNDAFDAFIEICFGTEHSR